MEELKTLTILFRAQKSLEKIIYNDVKRYGLNTTEFGVLEVLYHKGSMSIQDIKKKILIAASSMSYVIDTLVSKGYVTRIQQPKDKRSFLIDLTSMGKEKMAEIYPLHVEKIRERFDLVKEDELYLRELLKTIGKGKTSNQ